MTTVEEAHACVEATVRYAFELSYQVTMVKDATADYSDFASRRSEEER
jgi:ureidoacrylate peracid hydrolase